MSAKANAGCMACAGRKAAEAALALRTPARRVFGSLRAAVVGLAALLSMILFGEGVSLVSGCSQSACLDVLAIVNILYAFFNAVLIYGAITSTFHHIYSWISVSTIHVLIAAISIIAMPIAIPYCAWIVVFPVLHFCLQLLLLALAFGLAQEMRAGRPDDGWLQLNLSREAPLLPHPAGDPPTLKAKPDSPAVLAPSACSTAPPPVIARLPC